MVKTEHCPACGNQFLEVIIGDYNLCHACGTYRYVSLRPAEEENAEYFEQTESYHVKQNSVYKALFRFYRLFDSIFNVRNLLAKMSEFRINRVIQTKDDILEIGFGNGRWLYRRLKKHQNAYGIDLSNEAVSAFKKRYPQFKDRVQQTTTASGSFELVYANAIFEHLDNPDEFLKNIQGVLKTDGVLVMGIPTVNPNDPNISTDCDINFWKPYHRAIYSIEGLKRLLNRNGFRLVISTSVDSAIYRLFNALLLRGIVNVHTYRTPFYAYEHNESIFQFLNSLFKVPFIKSKSVWSKILIEKV